MAYVKIKAYILIFFISNHASYTVIFGLQIRALLGGKMEFIIVGGAPLSRETHEFIRVCLGAIVVPVINLKQRI